MGRETRGSLSNMSGESSEHPKPDKYTVQDDGRELRHSAEATDIPYTHHKQASLIEQDFMSKTDQFALKGIPGREGQTFNDILDETDSDNSDVREKAMHDLTTPLDILKGLSDPEEVEPIRRREAEQRTSLGSNPPILDIESSFEATMDNGGKFHVEPAARDEAGGYTPEWTIRMIVPTTHADGSSAEVPVTDSSAFDALKINSRYKGRLTLDPPEKDDPDQGKRIVRFTK